MFDAELVNNVFKQHIVSELYWLFESRNECFVFSTKSNLSVAPSGDLMVENFHCRLVTWGVDFYASYREDRERRSLGALALCCRGAVVGLSLWFEACGDSSSRMTC